MNPYTRKKRIVWLSLGWLVSVALLLPTLAPCDATVRIHLSQKAKVDAETITLGNVADILGPDPQQTDAMGGIELGRSPLPGQSAWVHPGQVASALKQHGWAEDQYAITGSGPVKVVRNYAAISSESIRSAVVEFIERHAPWDADQMKIRPIHYKQSHQLPPGDVALQVTAPKHTDWLGAVPFKVNLLVDGHLVQRTSVPAYIEVWQDVVLTAKPLGRNQPITSGDIQTQKMNLARVPAKAVVRPDQAIGKRANRSIAVNSILRTDQIEDPLMVRKGDIVQVLAESQALRIATQAVAKENGALGDNIQVMNLQSKKNIFAQVVDAQTVKVDF